jgi:uncharacterized protein YegP (UPF0339 family)
MEDQPHFYEAKDGHRWHFKAKNGKIIAESGEAYYNDRGARRAWHGFLKEVAPLVHIMEAAEKE